MSYKNKPDISAPAYIAAFPNTKSPALLERTRAAIKKMRARYLVEQHETGYWWYELESNVTITAEYLMLLYFLGLRDKEIFKKISNYILSEQRPDGTWAIHWGGKGDLSATVEAYMALKLAEYPEQSPPMRRARQFILANGGAGASRVFTRIFLALFGQESWSCLPSIPVELMLIPASFPFSIYKFSSWARSTFVPLMIVMDQKPVAVGAENFSLKEIYAGPWVKQHKKKKKVFWTDIKFTRNILRQTFFVLDRAAKIMEGLPRPLRAKGMELAQEWVFQHQEETGDWGGIQPAMVNSILALSAMGYGPQDPRMSAGLEALRNFTLDSGEKLVLQSCISPVWDTALTALALRYSGMPRDHRSLLRAAEWLASKQILKKGDWSVKRPDLEPGGWAFEFDNSWYPDVDDTAVVLMFLLDYKDMPGMGERIERGINWLLGMQCRDGGWGAFDVDNDFELLNQVPYADLEAMTDPSTPDIAGRVLEVVGKAGIGMGDPRVKKAIRYLKSAQQPDGSFWGRWGVNYIYGTWSVLMGLRAVGEDMSSPYVRRAVEWLKGHQNMDGGWGECCESYGDYSLCGQGTSTPSQTAWALLGLLAAEEDQSGEVHKGINFLLNAQKYDGTWDEPEFTGTGFPRYFMLRYHNYKNCFPLMALSRFVNGFVPGNGGSIPAPGPTMASPIA
ncbi:MAG: squalene--hopene cyclase [Actinomycetota bacterium]|nr:squalene--hopene cyclase [Actinomycetota bacterium]